MRRQSSWMAAAGAVLAFLGAPCLGGDGWVTAIATDEAVVGEDRLAEVEAELAALSARLDRLPSDRSSGLDSSSCRPSGPYAGYAFVFAKPHFSENASYRISDTNASRDTLVPFSYDHELTPRVWFGYVGASGLGLRYRYWQFDHDGDQVSIQDPGDGVGLGSFASVASGSRFVTSAGSRGNAIMDVTNGLEVHASDVEVTQRIHFRHLSATVGGGLRYARMDQDYRATFTRPWLDGLVFAHRSFKGLGPTLSLELERLFGFWGLSLFASARGSVVFGELHSHGGDFVNNADAVMGVGEAEIGLQRSRMLSCGGYLFVRGGYEAQVWHEAGSPNWASGDLGFEGFSLALGFAR